MWGGTSRGGSGRGDYQPVAAADWNEAAAWEQGGYGYEEDWSDAASIASTNQDYVGNPYAKRNQDVTLRTRRELFYEAQTFAKDIIPPATSSGALWYLRFIALALFLLAVLALLASFGLSYLQSAPSLPSEARPLVCAMVLALTSAFSLNLVVSQCYVFNRLQLHSKELVFAVPPPPPGAYRQSDFDADPTPMSLVPGLRELSVNLGCYTPFCGCGPQEGGHYELERESHAEIMSTYYWQNYLMNTQWWHGMFYSLMGLVQTWDIILNCIQPGVMHGHSSVDGEPRLPRLIHSGWLSAVAILLLGLIQVVNCRSLLKNALGTATAEKEWLAYDITGAEDTWVSAIDAENSTWRKEFMGHLNLTYAWMCVAAAAESCGAVHLARVADGLAAQTKMMVENHSKYRFRLKTMTEWDLKKVGIVTRIIQALILTVLNVEFFGISYGRSASWVSALTLVCVVLSSCTALWKAFIALQMARFSDPSDDWMYAQGRGNNIERAAVGTTYQATRTPGFRGRTNMGSWWLFASRKTGVRVLVLASMLAAAGTVLAGVGMSVHLTGACTGTTYSPLETARSGALTCWPRQDLEVGGPFDAYEAHGWDSGGARFWTGMLGVSAGACWLWLAYWGWSSSVSP